MKSTYRLAIAFLVLAAGSLRGADDDDSQNKAPPEEIPDFNQIDQYIYQPKSVLNYGFRFSSGIKASFFGQGLIASPEFLPNGTLPNIVRTYHDGSVSPDTRTMVVDTGNGITVTVPIVPDGKTNTWSYATSSQITPDGFMQFHVYSAQILDNEFHTSGRKGDMGWELTVGHDMGRLGKHLSWRLFAGMSVNDIQAADQAAVNAAVTTVTDTYDLFGETPPPAPYTGPSSNTQTVVDQNSNPVTNGTGGTQTITGDTTTLIGSSPLNRTTSTVDNMTSVDNHFKLHGSYVTFRGGPELVYNFTDRLHFNLSVGPALVYAGTQFTVDEALIPDTGGVIVDTLAGTTNRLLYGYYVDATMQYDFTERSGVYLGAFYQSAGSYEQSVHGGSSGGYGSTLGVGNYTTKVEFNDTQGVRTGVSFKF